MREKAKEIIVSIIGPSWKEMLTHLKAIGEALMFLLGDIIRTYLNSGKSGYFYKLLQRFSDALNGAVTY